MKPFGEESRVDRILWLGKAQSRQTPKPNTQYRKRRTFEKQERLFSSSQKVYKSFVEARGDHFVETVFHVLFNDEQETGTACPPVLSRIGGEMFRHRDRDNLRLAIGATTSEGFRSTSQMKRCRNNNETPNILLPNEVCQRQGFVPRSQLSHIDQKTSCL